jgi:hypothetical protein
MAARDATPLESAEAVNRMFASSRDLKTRINGNTVTRIRPSGYLSVTCSHCGAPLKSDGNLKDLRAFVARHCKPTSH